MLGTDYHPPLPGAFTHESYTFPAGQQANVFRPPTSPSQSQSSQFATSQHTSITMTETRNRPLVINKKRARQSTISEASSYPSQPPHNWSLGLPPRDFNTDGDAVIRSPSGAFISEAPSPMPFVNTRYQLAGGLDTPTAQMAGYFDQESEYSDVNYRRTISNGRRRVSSTTPSAGPDGYYSFARLPSSASLENNGLPRIQSPKQEQQKTGWGLLGVVGGVVGKVWQFCKAGAFSGFSAGGGQKYEMDANHTEEQELQDTPNAFSFPQQQAQQQFGMETRIWSAPLSPVPGQFPRDEDGSGYFVNTLDYATPSRTSESSARPVKRRQISQADSRTGMDASWVVVNNTPTAPPASQNITPRRAPARFSVATASSSARRGTAYASSASRVRAVPRVRTSTQSRLPRSENSYTSSPSVRTTIASTSTASYASPTTRTYVPSPSRIPIATTTGSASPVGGNSGRSTPTWRPSTPGIPAPASISSNSALTASPSTANTAAAKAAAAAQAKKWAAKKKREDAETDLSMRRLNAQLKAMIREGKEALGTRVEIEMCDPDEDEY